MRAARARRLDGVAFIGGGTGGHLFPGIAVAERALERFPGCRVVFFRTERSVEDRVFHGRGFELHTLRIAAPGKNPRRWWRYLRQVASSRREIRAVLGKGLESEAWAAFGLGGYASLPGILEARRLGIPVVLLEQNRIAGKVNRLLAPFVDGVSVSYRETRLRFCRRMEVTGNPVRRQVTDAAQRREAFWGGRGPDGGGKRTVLVVGGSQGAGGINRAICDALPGLAAFSGKIRWIHVTGDADKEMVTEAYRMHGWEAQVLAYSPDLPDLMARSDLVVSRAGGTTLAELAVMGLPSVLVPYPHHRDRHQLWNARSLERGGAARLLDEKELNVESLNEVFERILFAAERLESMGRNARALARPDATDAVLELALDLLKPCPSLSASSS